MFATTVVNFLLSILRTAGEVAGFVVSIRKALVIDIDYPLSEKPELVHGALRNMNLVGFWAGDLPVSIKSSLPDPTYSYSLQVYLSDLIVIWRAGVLFPDRQWVILIPFILWLGAVGE